jgi:hypothetical protein
VAAFDSNAVALVGVVQGCHGVMVGQGRPSAIVPWCTLVATVKKFFEKGDTNVGCGRFFFASLGPETSRLWLAWSEDFASMVNTSCSFMHKRMGQTGGAATKEQRSEKEKPTGSASTKASTNAGAS